MIKKQNNKQTNNKIKYLDLFLIEIFIIVNTYIVFST